MKLFEHNTIKCPEEEKGTFRKQQQERKKNRRNEFRKYLQYLITKCVMQSHKKKSFSCNIHFIVPYVMQGCAEHLFLIFRYAFSFSFALSKAPNYRALLFLRFLWRTLIKRIHFSTILMNIIIKQAARYTFCDFSLQEKLIKLCNDENLMLFRSNI